MSEKMREPDWTDSETGPSECWKSPFHSMQDRLLMADGAIAFRDKVIENLRQQLAALQSQAPEGKPEGVNVTTPAEQEGWKLVPVEPTEEMLLASFGGGHKKAGLVTIQSQTGTMRNKYRAMLAAAPTPPQQQEQKHGSAGSSGEAGLALTEAARRFIAKVRIHAKMPNKVEAEASLLEAIAAYEAAQQSRSIKAAEQAAEVAFRGKAVEVCEKPIQGDEPAGFAWTRRHIKEAIEALPIDTSALEEFGMEIAKRAHGCGMLEGANVENFGRQEIRPTDLRAIVSQTIDKINAAGMKEGE